MKRKRYKSQLVNPGKLKYGAAYGAVDVAVYEAVDVAVYEAVGRTASWVVYGAVVDAVDLSVRAEVVTK